MSNDQIDTKRAKVYALCYLMADIKAGVTTVYPQIHGLYETWEAATIARDGKQYPENYFLVQTYWRIA